MLQFKIVERILSKGYYKPYTYLRKMVGFSSGKAVKFSQGKQQSISLADLSHLCATLHCTPNDILYWQQTPSYTLPATHPCISQLQQPQQLASWGKAIQQLDPDQAAEIYKLVQDKIAEKK